MTARDDRVPADAARAHILELVEYGIGLKGIASIAGVSNATISRIIYGEPTRNRPPRARIEKRVHAAIMAIEPTVENKGRTGMIDGTGMRRRVQALVRIGYPLSSIAARVNVSTSSLHKGIGCKKVHVRTARAVARLYEELENRPLLDSPNRNARAAVRFGTRKGWFPPAAWDEDTIDDPAAVPDMGEQQRRAEAVLEDLEWLARAGENREDVVERLGVTWAYVVSVAGKAGRQDLLDTIQGFTRDNARKASKPGRAA